MEAPNILLYNLFRHDLRLTDGKSLELMDLLDKEYKSGVKDDLSILDKKMDTRFDLLDKKIDAVDKKIGVLEKRFDTLDYKIDKQGYEIRIGLRDARVDMNRWMIGIILTMIGLFIASLFKK
jgi:hypothetical protein